MTRSASTGGEALSLDGRSFSYEMPVDSPVSTGDLVVLRTVDGRLLGGQIHEKRVDPQGQATGRGVLLGEVGSDGLAGGTSGPFSRAAIELPTPELWDSLRHSAGATMPVGSAHAGLAALRPNGVNRHTFMCGQSGSGKSYSLGVVLEQIILDTDLDLIVLDPNADFVRLDETLDSATEAEAERLAATTFDVLRPKDPDNPLRARFTAMRTASKAAILQLDPLADRREYNTLLELSDEMRTRPPQDVVDDLLASDDSDRARLAERIQNIGMLEWQVWAADKRSAVEHLADRARVTVMDLSGFDYPQERLIVALELLDHLWANREARRPVLLVIDEAHNVCSANPTTQLERATTDRLIQIASEGRKYGIWLLLCTQRPSRINQGVLSQCDNLILMRMNSRGDLSQLQETFGFVPAEMLGAAPFFTQGESLMAGGFAPVPMFVRVGRRRTREGGSDVPVPMES